MKLFMIGGSVWPGISKLAEECGEVVQVIGKLMGTGGKSEHWDGTDLRKRMVEEMADVRAAVDFVAMHNFSPEEIGAYHRRAGRKLELFVTWHGEYKEGQK